jgi:hypothetical protein
MWNNWVQPNKWCIIIHCYALFFTIIARLFTIITAIEIMAIIALLSEVDVSIFEQNKHPWWATHRGYHVGEESQRLDHLIRALAWTCGSWDLHTVLQPTRRVCDDSRWPGHAVNQTRSYSGRIWSPMLFMICTRLGPSGFPLSAPRRMLWIALNLLQFSASGQIDANCSDFSETETKHKTKRRIRTILCIATDGSVAWMCTHHGLFHNLNEKQPKYQKDDCEIK